MKILVTGAAGFIGMFVSRLLLERGDEVVGLDNLNEYYDVNLKKSRLALLHKMPGFRFVRLDLADRAGMEKLFREEGFQRVVHLAAQAGVRYSLINPHAYIDSNLVGTFHLLEGCRSAGVEHVVYASTSSVYGANTLMPFSAHRAADHPISLYAATKKANELMAHSYCDPVSDCRRRDCGSSPCTAHSAGRTWRCSCSRTQYSRRQADRRVQLRASTAVTSPTSTTSPRAWCGRSTEFRHRNPDWDSDDPDPGTSSAPYRLYNIGNSQPVELLRYIEVLENHLGRKAEKNLLPMQPGDVPDTYADVDDLITEVGYRPSTPVEVGVGPLRRLVP